MPTQLPPVPSKLKSLDVIADLLDSKFRIPGTDIRFGADFLIGLIPYAGDLMSFGLSGGLVIAMAKNGASGMVIVKMLWNILVDTVIGSIPILGDLFDLHYKANRRNFDLLREHYDENKHQGSAMPVIILVIILLLAMFVLLLWLVWKIASWSWGVIF